MSINLHILHSTSLQLLVLIALLGSVSLEGFTIVSSSTRSQCTIRSDPPDNSRKYRLSQCSRHEEAHHRKLSSSDEHNVNEREHSDSRRIASVTRSENNYHRSSMTRRDAFSKSFQKLAVVTTAAASTTTPLSPQSAQASVGTLPEFDDTNVVMQGLTVNVADSKQLEQMINFLKDAFLMTPLRQQVIGSISEIWMGYGPEQMSVPKDFTAGVSSFAQYGGHASICIRCDSSSADVFFTPGSTKPPGDNVAFVQLGVPSYRVSQMIPNGASVTDAFGFVNVVSPCGIPMRGIVGIRPDPIMFVAITTSNIEASTQFYNQLGFVPQPYPVARPNQGQFEPPQPDNSVYLAPSPNSMGVLLLPPEKTGGLFGFGASSSGASIKPNPALASLNLIYTPSMGGEGGDVPLLSDPSGVPVAFQSIGEFSEVESSTRITLQEAKE